MALPTADILCPTNGRPAICVHTPLLQVAMSTETHHGNVHCSHMISASSVTPTLLLSLPLFFPSSLLYLKTLVDTLLTEVMITWQPISICSFPLAETHSCSPGNWGRETGRREERWLDTRGRKGRGGEGRSEREASNMRGGRW